MLFKIDESCLSAIDKNDEDAIFALDSLAFNRKKGNNIIFAKKKILEDLMKRDCFSLVTRNVFKKMFIKVEGKQYLKNTKKYILIVDEIKGHRLSLVDDKKECKITLKELAKSELSNKTTLITENIEEAKFYNMISKYYTKCNQMKKCNCSFNEHHGGGGTITTVLEQIINKRENMCLCIVDSDKKFPGASNGDTMERVKRLCKNKEEDIWKLFCLDVHEIENLIPIEWVKNVTNDIENIGDCIKFLEHLLNTGDEAIYFFDMKGGIKKSKFICSDKSDYEINKRYNKDENFRNYWESYIIDYNIALNNVNGDFIIPGTCKKLLERIISKYENEFHIEQVEEHLKEKWLELGSVLFAWGCVGERIIS